MFVTMFAFPTDAQAWSESISVSKGDTVACYHFSPNPTVVYEGKWDVYIDGKRRGEAIYLQDNRADGRNYVSYSNLNTVISACNGNPSWARSRISSTYIQKGGSNIYHGVWVRDILKYCGCTLDYTYGRVNIYTTPNPSAKISVPSSAKAGSNVSINIQGSQYTPSQWGYNGIKYTLKINGSPVKSGSGNRNFSDRVNHTFSSAGTYRITLEVEDEIGRTGKDEVTINVTGGGSPPPAHEPPPAPTDGPVAYFAMPATGYVDEPIQITDRSRAGDNPIVDRDWSTSPSNYSGTLKDKGGTLRFKSVGTYMVTLTVTDSAGKSDTCELDIVITEQPPPPPPPNGPPVARFDAPRTVGIGEEFEVVNKSTDKEGPIAKVKWTFRPKDGVEENLGDTGGTVRLLKEQEYNLELYVEDEEGLSDTYDRDIEVINKEPKASFSIPSEVTQGDDVRIKNRAYDPDGEVVECRWEVELPEGGKIVFPYEEKELPTTPDTEVTVYFDKEGIYKFTLTAVDEWGKEGTETKEVVVKPAIPTAYFDWNGHIKQNRKLTFEEQGVTSERYPIIPEKNQWVIIPVSGEATLDAVRVKPDESTATHGISTVEGTQVYQIMSSEKLASLYKKPGTYKVKLRVSNTAGHTSEWYEQDFEVVKDEPPIADFNLQSAYIRNPDDNNLAAIDVVCESYSPDGDVIASRIWKYKYDSNNDGSFEDEDWVILDSGNNPTPTLKTDEVGRYYFELEVKEDFGEPDPTIPEFIEPEDYLGDNTDDKPMNEKQTEVLNVKPAVAFESFKKKKVDIVFTTGEVDESKIYNLQGLITTYLETELNTNNVEYGTIKAVETSTISTDEQGAAKILSGWRSVQIPQNFSGSLTDISGGWAIDTQKLYATGSYRPARGYINPSPDAYNTGDADIKFVWGIQNDARDFSHGEAGFMFRIKDDRNYYVYIMDNHDACGNVLYNYQEVLVKVTNGSRQIIGTNSFPSFHAGQRHNINIVLKGNNIKIYRDGDLRFDYTDNNNPHSKGSYGFYVWDQYGAYFSNIAVTTKATRTLDEVVNYPPLSTIGA